jgi:hypothetical protein
MLSDRNVLSGSLSELMTASSNVLHRKLSGAASLELLGKGSDAVLDAKITCIDVGKWSIVSYVRSDRISSKRPIFSVGDPIQDLLFEEEPPE